MEKASTIENGQLQTDDLEQLQLVVTHPTVTEDLRLINGSSFKL